MLCGTGLGARSSVWGTAEVKTRCRGSRGYLGEPELHFGHLPRVSSLGQTFATLKMKLVPTDESRFCPLSSENKEYLQEGWRWGTNKGHRTKETA